MNIEKLKKHKFIVLCYEHYTPLGVIRGLGESGIKSVGIIIKNKHNKVASASKYLQQVIFAKDEQEQFKILLEKFGNEPVKPIVYPCDDKITEVVDAHYDEIKNKFYISNAGVSGRISYYQDKDNINKLAQKYGLNVPQTWKTKRGLVPEGIIYPIITKTLSSNAGSWKEDYYICYSEDELKEAYKNIKGEDLLLQQYITKVNELCLDGLSINNGQTVLQAIASRYTYVLPDNYSAEMIVQNFEKETQHIFLKQVLELMFAEIGYNGIFSVEFMVDKNETLWFLEINFRSSTWNYAAAKLGMNLPVLWAYGQLEEKLPDNVEKEIPDGYKAMAELPDFGWRVLKKKISLKDWIKEVKSCKCLYFYNKEDKLPFYMALFWKIENKVVKVINKKLFKKEYRW